MAPSHSVDFFDDQFRRQIRDGEFALNPFEQKALQHLKGKVLDLGCGLGNLALEAGRRGCDVLAIDASPTAVARINQDAAAAGLGVRAEEADLSRYRIQGHYDAIVAIGLLMFFRRAWALELLEDMKTHVNPGGTLVINVLIEGTTFMGMFQQGNYYLFGRDELETQLAGWKILASRRDSFDAPGGTCKEFATVVAEKAGVADGQHNL